MVDMRFFSIAPMMGLVLAWAGPAHAEDFRPCENWWTQEEAPASEEGKPWTFVVAPYVYHWNPDPEHKHAFIFALERRGASDRLCGISLFRNSFGQPSGYAYIGQRWNNLWGHPHLTAKLTAGVIFLVALAVAAVGIAAVVIAKINDHANQIP